MIQSKKDYYAYLETDRKAAYYRSARPRPFLDHIWRFARLLRKAEYYKNCRRDFFGKLYFAYLKVRLEQLSVQLGFTIPLNTCGPGLSIAHRGTIVIHGGVRIGANCRIHVDVNIGASSGNSQAVPKIGNNVYIGPGAKIFGSITIADGIAIGANAVVNKSFLEPNITIAGVPAKKIADKGSKGLLKEDGFEND